MGQMNLPPRGPPHAPARSGEPAAAPRRPQSDIPRIGAVFRKLSGLPGLFCILPPPLGFVFTSFLISDIYMMSRFPWEAVFHQRRGRDGVFPRFRLGLARKHFPFGPAGPRWRFLRIPPGPRAKAAFFAIGGDRDIVSPPAPRGDRALFRRPTRRIRTAGRYLPRKSRSQPHGLVISTQSASSEAYETP